MILKHLWWRKGRVLLTIAGISIGIVVARFLADGPHLKPADESNSSPYLADLRTFRASGLGQALLGGEIPPEVAGIGLEDFLPEMRMFLRNSILADGDECDGQEMDFLGFRWV